MTIQMQNFTPEDLCRHQASREQAWNSYLSSLDSHEIHALCGPVFDEAGMYNNVARTAQVSFTTDTSWECLLHDLFVADVIKEDDIGCRIMILMGEL